MLSIFSTLFKNVKKSVENSNFKKTTQGGIGIVIFILFVLSSFVVNQTVQALNQAAGNYGYYGGTYGYNASTTSSDYPPSAPSSLSCSASSTSAGSCSWTAPTTTTGGTNLNNLDHYLYNYGTSAVSSCTSGTTPTGISFSLTTLNPATTYYVAVCAVDTNSNEGTVATSSFTTQSITGGGTAGLVSTGQITTPAPTVITTPTAAPTVVVTPTVAGPSISPSIVADAAQLVVQLGVAQNKASETTYQARVTSSASEFRVTLAADVKAVATNFVTYGTSSAAVKLGAGERLAVVRDILEILGSKVASNATSLLTVAEQIANGQKPTIRNLTKEQSQLPQVLKNFEKLAGHRPDFKNTKEDLAWNTLQYRVRFARDLNKEKVGIGKFKVVFNKIPKTPLDWATVRAWGYALK